ncbi:MAG: glycerol-3-phosphate 1-O-acyltransferase PlsY [Candidatus Omnitrophica bacterium]|nr:glycerol-3-phosphate 1-O-acyltransferase PlsY [Candidatus Omnitrophota bacterium]
MIFAAIFLSYLIGSIPTAYIFGKFYKGIDIRQHGSGNVGATNVFRVLGKVPGSIVLILDILKGVIAVILLSSVFSCNDVWQLIALSLAAVCGHNWTIFLKFKGGKGIATSLGVLIALAVKLVGIRLALMITVETWLICFILTSFVSLSSILAGLAFPLAIVLTHQHPLLIGMSVVFGAFVIIRHKPNIQRLIQGKEPRVPIGFYKKRPIGDRQ